MGLAALVSCSSTKRPVLLSAGTPSSNYLAARNQGGNGKSVVVEEVVLQGTNGYVAVHADGDGAPSEVILGVSALLPAGKYRRVVVDLKSPLRATTTVFVMLHRQSHGSSTFDYPKADPPISEGSTVLTVAVTVAVHR